MNHPLKVWEAAWYLRSMEELMVDVGLWEIWRPLGTKPEVTQEIFNA